MPSSSQRPYFLSSFLAAFRQQGPNMPNTTQQQPNKHTSQTPTTTSSSTNNGVTPTTTRSISTSAVAAAHAHAHASSHQTSRGTGVTIHSPRGTTGGPGIPIPTPSGRRRGSDSSSEGFRDAIGADKWYIGGKAATGEEKFFKLGVVRRVRSNDGLSLDRLSL